MEDPHALLRAKLNLETARMPWRDLQRFFAAGRTLAVARELSLVDVACAIAGDATTEVETWTRAGLLAAVSDEQAREWFEADASPWCVVVRPWVLVQAPDAPAPEQAPG